MKEIKVRLQPTEVVPAQFEDLLATDTLFVEYFNSFLQLPSFPEPLCFNKESGGFEILTDERRRLAEEIKAAVRAGRRRKRIYRPVKNHAFSNIPLIPMEEPQMPEEKEIDTAFTVKTLNKEQGIEWIKKERLPSFLASDCYLEYQLGKLISQAQASGVPDEFICFKIDTEALFRKPKTKQEVQEEKSHDETQELIRNCYVCMGEASTTTTEAWVTQAKMVNTASTTESSSESRPRPVSAVVPTRVRSACKRPTSAISVTDSGTRTDSGFWTPSVRSTTFGSTLDVETHYTTSENEDDLDEDISGKLFGNDLKPVTPRPSDTVCLLAVDVAGPRRPVYSVPVNESSDGASQSSDESHTSEVDSVISSSEVPADSDDTDSNGVFKSLEELGSVVVGTSLKYALAEISNSSPAEIVAKSELIKSILPNEKFYELDKNALNHMVLVTGEGSVSNGATEPPTVSPPKVPRPPSASKTESPPVSPEPKPKNAADESDEDSVLNSDSDYDEERDQFFRRHKQQRKFQLLNRKGIEEFKKFLSGTLGERNWNFWLDIERARLMSQREELSNYLVAIRERYQKHGAPFELSTTTKAELELTEPSSWTLEKLIDIQYKIVEPLILYWGPRFLLRQNIHAQPDKHFLYQHQHCLTKPMDSHPNPPTISLLPLRPKTCMPRMQSNPAEPELKQIQISSMFDELKNSSMENDIKVQSSLSDSACHLPTTTPRIGMRRRYLLDEQPAPPNKKTEKDKQNNKKKQQQKTPRQLISPVMKRDLQRPKTAQPQSSPQVRLDSRTCGEDYLYQEAPYLRRPHFILILVAAKDRTVRISAGNSKSDKWETSSVTSTQSSPDHKMSASSVSRPTSAASRQSSDLSELSEFLGGRRMEGLLQALSSERKAGGVLRRFLTSTGNKVWLNCLRFWLAVQEYHCKFYAEVIDPFFLDKKASAIYAEFVGDGAPRHIDCSLGIKESIYRALQPPFEELFDEAEEHVLELLYEAWSQMLVCDMSTFDKVELIEEKRHLDTKSKYFVSLQRRGIIKDRPESPTDLMAGYHDPVYDESLLERIPEEHRDYTLEKLIRNRIELEYFRHFLAENYASMDLMCWMDIETFKRIPHTEEKRRDLKAKDVKIKYLNKKYFFGPNSPAGKEGQEQVAEAAGGWGKLLDDRPPPACLLKVQKYVQLRLEKKWLPLFLATPEFADRQRPRSGMDDVVEDVMIQRKKKSQAIWKMLESRWVSSSKDIITFRKALLNSVTVLQFRRFVSIRGDNYENDVLFWEEVQRYKDLCHLHSDKLLIQQKTLAIINCFIDSPIPPSLQIDIPQEMADALIERKLEGTPYLFREAQLTVFRVLFTHWNEFCSFRSNLAADKILPTIERHRRRAKAEDKKRRREAEAKQERENARKRAMGIPVEPDEDVVDASVDPFERYAMISEDEETKKSEAMSWSYSQYMQALDEEEVLNDVDQDTFSSLVSRPKSGVSNASRGSNGSKSSHSSEKKAKQESRTKSEEVPKPSRLSTDYGSQADVRPKSSSSRRPLSNSNSQEHLLNGKIEPVKIASKPPPNGNKKKVPTEERRLARAMPPLVSKK